MALEPLSMVLKASLHIQGIVWFEVENTVSLNADDLLLYFVHSLSPIPVIQSILKKLVYFSSYKLKCLKSVFLLIPPKKLAQ